MPLSCPAGVAMLGPPTPRWLARPIGRSIEELVPPDPFYRFLDAKLDLSFVRAWVQDLFAGGSAHHPRGLRHAGRRDGEQADARPAPAGVLPLAPAPRARGGRRHLRDRREHPRRRGQALLGAAGQNLKRWLTRTGWGRRYGPCGSLALSASVFGLTILTTPD